MKISTLNKILSVVLLITLTACITITSLIFANRVKVFTKLEYKIVEVPTEVPQEIWDIAKKDTLWVILPSGRRVNVKAQDVHYIDEKNDPDKLFRFSF